MANEISVTATLAYTNAAQQIASESISLVNSLFNITGVNYAKGTMLVPTTAGGKVIPVNDLATLGWACLKNNDPTNYVDILTALSGTDIIRLKPGEPALFRFGSGITAPAAQANTAAVLLEFLILEN